MSEERKFCAHYTPSEVADLVAQSIRNSDPKVVLDPAAGDGALLLAVNARFPEVGTMAIDIDRAAVSRLRRAIPNCTVSICDALESRSVRRSKVWSFRACIDVVVANPPFGSLGEGPRLVVVAAWGERIRCGVGAAHILSAVVGFLPRQLVAVIPDSMLHSERDARARELIASRYSLDVVRSLGSSVFANTGASVSLIELVRRPGVGGRHVSERTREAVIPKVGPVSLIRGGLPMHGVKVSSTGLPLLHTTDLRDRRQRIYVKRLGRGVVSGPVILLPRVGLPAERHLVPANLAVEHQLSDCVVAICCQTDDVASSVSNLLRDHFRELVDCWGGTGAQYTTLMKLRRCLSKLGIAVETVDTGASCTALRGECTVNGSHVAHASEVR